MINILDLNFQGVEKAIGSFLIETEEGPVLIETGPYSCLDHAGGAWALAKLGARIYLHPFGVAHMANPEKLWKSAKLIYGDQMEILWGKMEPIDQNALRPVDHGETIEIGDKSIKAWHTPGHANHHIAGQIEKELFCGDVAGVRIGKGPVVPPCPPPDINLEKWEESISLIKDLRPEKLYLTHFGNVLNINDHLDQLSHILTSWANWMKPRFDNNEAPKEVIPKFQKFTEQQLRTIGLGDMEINQYETANPSWMSVAGLMRYWKKKKEAEQ